MKCKVIVSNKRHPGPTFSVAEREDKGDSAEKTNVVELINVSTQDCVTVPRNSDF